MSRGGIQTLCLADGAGSASHSDLGAQVVVNEGCSALVEQFHAFVDSDDGARVKIELLTRILDQVGAVADRHGLDPGNLASTFIGLAASGGTFLGAHVGDGVIGYQKDGDLHVISGPDNNEFANQTTFVTSAGAVKSMRLFRGSLEGVSGFILMSDGTGESLYNARTGELAGACSKLINAVGAAPAKQGKNSEYKKRLRRLLNTDIRDATKDDCSIGILGRPASCR